KRTPLPCSHCTVSVLRRTTVSARSGSQLYCVTRPRSSRYCSAVYSPKSILAISASDSSISFSTSSNPWWTMRKPPPVKALLPPRHSSGARSRTSTFAPCSRADSAAQRAALPPPTTITSKFVSAATLSLRLDVQRLGNFPVALQLAVDRFPELLQ